MTVVSALPFWDDTSQIWDTLYLGGKAFPGLASVTGDVSRDVEIKKAKGQDGATILDNGYTPAKLDIELRISSFDQWLEIQQLLPEIHPRAKGGERSPLALGHPSASILGVYQVYITRIGFPVLADNKEIVFSISAIEWLPQPEPVKKGAGTGGARGGGGGGASKGNLDDELEDDEFDYDDEYAARDEAQDKWEEENSDYGGAFGMTSDEEKAFAKEYADQRDAEDDDTSDYEYEETAGLGDEGQDNASDLADFEDEGW